jgi:hypothetical protein
MPITSFFHGLRYDPETARVMGVAYEMICATFQLDDQEPIDEAVAKKIIELTHCWRARSRSALRTRVNRSSRHSFKLKRPREPNIRQTIPIIFIQAGNPVGSGFGCEPCATGWKPHRIHQLRPLDGWEMARRLTRTAALFNPKTHTGQYWGAWRPPRSLSV